MARPLEKLLSNLHFSLHSVSSEHWQCYPAIFGFSTFRNPDEFRKRERGVSRRATDWTLHRLLAPPQRRRRTIVVTGLVCMCTDVCVCLCVCRFKSVVFSFSHVRIFLAGSRNAARSAFTMFVSSQSFNFFCKEMVWILFFFSTDFI